MYWMFELRLLLEPKMEKAELFNLKAIAEHAYFVLCFHLLLSRFGVIFVTEVYDWYMKVKPVLLIIQYRRH